MQQLLSAQKAQSFYLVDLARRARRLPHGVAAVVILTPAILFGGALVGQWLTSSFILPPLLGYLESIPNVALRSGLENTIWLSMTYLGILATLWTWIRLYEKRQLWTLGLEWRRDAGDETREAFGEGMVEENVVRSYHVPGAPPLWAHAMRHYGIGFAVGALMMGVWTAGMWASRTLVIENSPPGYQGRTALAGVGVALVGWLIQGGVEEILFRGWLMGVVAARHRVWIGVVGSSATFGLLHGLNPGFGLLPLFNLCLYGLFMALWALKEGSLWGICGLHSAWNWAQGNIFGLDVSGGQAGGGMLIDLGQRGPDWLTGGAFGPEGGLGVTLLLLVGIGVVCALLWGKSPGNAPPM
jgi:membrane protease YdiL (CAAX protease family)